MTKGILVEGILLEKSFIHKMKATNGGVLITVHKAGKYFVPEVKGIWNGIAMVYETSTYTLYVYDW